MLRPWSDRRINDCGERLYSLLPELLCLRPHPYQALGAPYGEGADPFVLRAGVRHRLVAAQEDLMRRDPQLRFAIFDAWRPIAVQRFMVDYALAEERARLGLPQVAAADDIKTQAALDAVEKAVGRFWAPPSHDPCTPPPHSTGAAVDLTLADEWGRPLDMGGAIDAIGAVSEPAYYAEAALHGQNADAKLFHQRRSLLKAVLEAEGFCQHPNEWWHFSYGDQLWAWKTGQEQAIYGRVDPTSDLGAGD